MNSTVHAPLCTVKYHLVNGIANEYICNKSALLHYSSRLLVME